MSRAERSWQPSTPPRNGRRAVYAVDARRRDAVDAVAACPPESDDGGAINDAERIVSLSDGDDYHRELRALKSHELVAECECQGYHYSDGWCAHVASLWCSGSVGRSSWPTSTSAARTTAPPA